jgi:hypothetical protein
VRSFVLAVTLAFVAALLALTVHAVAQSGLDILTALSALVLVLLGVGIAGALRHPPDR